MMEYKQIELTPRLRAVAERIPQGANMVDVGTDHAFLPVWLLQQGRIARAIAADLREGPLSRAKTTAVECGRTDEMEFRLCDGLMGISPDEVNAVAIAGMGGETIVHILSQAPWIQNETVTLVLQPMSTQPELRCWLVTNQFSLIEEQTVREGDTLYTVMLARFGEQAPLTPTEQLAGRQWQGMDDSMRGELLQLLMRKTARALEGVTAGKHAQNIARKAELELQMQGLLDMEREWNEWQR